MTTAERTTTRGGVGDSPPRPDGPPKVRGDFAYSSDLWHAEMLWGATLRSPHPSALIRTVDITAALATPGVHAVLTADDVPGAKTYGLEVSDQPVLATGRVRYVGEPVAVVAADHPETARRAIARIAVDYEVLQPVTDPRRAAFDPDCPPVHASPAHDHTSGGVGEPGREALLDAHPRVPNLIRHQPVRRGDVAAARARADVVVTREYRLGMQDQAPLGPESGLAVPADDGGVDLYVATQWLHVDQQQLAPCLGLPPEKVRLTLAGVGGAFGAREDLSMHAHACLLALHTGRPVKMSYGREESFAGHVHRHPATARYTHGATRDGRIVFAEAEMVLDGGAYASTTAAVVGVASSLGLGPYRIPDLAIDVYGVYTNNPPCGAMRGFGAVQAAFCYESQLDALAAELGIDPVELRVRNAMAEGDVIATGQVVDMPLPMADMLRRAAAAPLPAPSTRDLRALPGGVSGATRGEGVRRGVGYGVGMKNICFSEDFDDSSTARVRLQVVGGEPAVLVHTAAAEVGQGLVTVQAQIARTELGVAAVTIHPADTSVASAGSSSASRQSYVTGGAVQAACRAVASSVVDLARRRGLVDGDAALRDGAVLAADGTAVDLVTVLGDHAVEETRTYRHRPTHPLDPVTGQGRSHVQFAMCVHRAVVDVDVELGLVKVVELAAVQDVGRVLHPVALRGQIHGGSAQGLGLALMEQLQVRDGRIINPSFTDYLVPTVLDVPPMPVQVLENPDPHSPYGLRGVGEPPTLSSTPAIVAAVRAATGRALTSVPLTPESISGVDA